MSRIITLTSDLGLKDYYLSVWKSALLSEIQNVNIVDISHQIESYNVMEAYYIFNNSYRNFPKNTIHILGINATYNKNFKLLIAKKKGHFFVSPDNGLLSLLGDDSQYDYIKEIRIENTDKFLLKNTFTHWVKNLIEDESKINLCDDCISHKKLKLPQPIYKEDIKTLIGSVIYIDNFGDAVTNISKNMVELHFPEKIFKINVNFRFISKIYSYYDEITEKTQDESIHHGNAMALYTENDLIEIAIYKSGAKTGGANTLLGLKTGMEIKITKD